MWQVTTLSSVQKKTKQEAIVSGNPETSVPLPTAKAVSPADEALATTESVLVEGPMAQEGDIRLSGRYVAGHDIVFSGTGPEENETPPFLIVNDEYLNEQFHKPKRMYVARSPDWADVVHGFDPELRFIERDQTQELSLAVRDELLGPSKRGANSQLHSLFVLGAPEPARRHSSGA